MPIYEYTCQDCHAEFELLRSYQEADAAATCQNCQGQNTTRKLSLFNASSGGRALTSASSCNGCSGGSCSTCGSER